MLPAGLMKAGSRRRAALGAIVAVALLVPLLQVRVAHASTALTWTGANHATDTNWSDSANWSPAQAPTSGDTVTFDGNASSFTTTDDIASLSLAGVTFSAAGFTVNRSSTETLTLTGAFSDTNSGTAGTNTINVPLVLDTGAGGFSSAKDTLALNGAITDTSAHPNVTFTGGVFTSFVLNATNTYTGTTTITPASTLGPEVSAQHAGALSSGDVSVQNGATLEVKTSTAFDNALTVDGQGLSASTPALYASGVAATWSGPITLGSHGATIGAGNVSSLTISGSLTGTTQLTVHTDAIGVPVTIASSAPNTGFTGSTVVAAGTLQLNNATGPAVNGSTITVGSQSFAPAAELDLLQNGQLPSNANVTVNATGTLNFSSVALAQTINSLTLNAFQTISPPPPMILGSAAKVMPNGNGQLTLTSITSTPTANFSPVVGNPSNLNAASLFFAGSSPSIQTAASGGSTTIAAQIFGADFTVNPSGSGGTVVMLGDSAQQSATDSVDAGFLFIDGDWTQVGIDPSFGELEGSGTVGDISSSFGTLFPIDHLGNPQTLTASSYADQGGSRLDIQLNGSTAGAGAGHYSQLAITFGTVTLDNTLLQVSTGGGFSPTPGQTFTIVSNGGGQPISGTFSIGSASLPEGSEFRAGGHNYRITYLGNGGNDVVLTALGNAFDSGTTGSATPNPANTGDTVTLNATVTGQPGQPTPTGTVTFEENGSTLGPGPVTLDSNGKASLQINSFGAGTHDLSAVYSGDSTYNGSSGAFQEVVNAPASSPSPSSSPGGGTPLTNGPAPPPSDGPPNVLYIPLQTIVTNADGGGTIIAVNPSNFDFFLIVIPPGAFPPGTTVTLWSVSGRGLPPGTVDAFAVSCLAPDGSHPTAAKPIQALVFNGNILAADGMFQLVGTNVQGTDSTVADIVALVRFTHDPVFAVIGPSRAGAYRMIGSDGGVFPFGGAEGDGSTGNLVLNKPIVASAATPSGHGYWLVASDGGVFPFGDAQGFGSLGNVHLNKPIVSMAATATGHGYWLVASDGGVFPFGDAQGFGSTGNIKLNKPIVGVADTGDGGGYWLVASDGGIFPFGDAKGFGSTGNIKLNKPIVGMAATPSGNGYWLVASDGGIFPFGDAGGFGSTGNLTLNKPIIEMIGSPHGKGYLLIASDGGVFPFGDALGSGSLGNVKLNKPIVTAIPG